MNERKNYTIDIRVCHKLNIYRSIRLKNQFVFKNYWIIFEKLLKVQ